MSLPGGSKPSTLEHNLTRVDFNRLLGDVMTIADEVDSQLTRQLASYITESKKDGKEVAAWDRMFSTNQTR